MFLKQFQRYVKKIVTMTSTNFVRNLFFNLVRSFVESRKKNHIPSKLVIC